MLRFLMKTLDSYGDDYRTAQLTIPLEVRNDWWSTKTSLTLSCSHPILILLLNLIYLKVIPLYLFSNTVVQISGRWHTKHASCVQTGWRKGFRSCSRWWWRWLFSSVPSSVSRRTQEKEAPGSKGQRERRTGMKDQRTSL